MDLNQAGASAPGRTESFYNGVNGTPGSAASSLDEQSAVFNSKVPGRFTPQSVLQSVQPSGNGMSAQDAGRVLPGGYRLPVPNGIGDSSYDAAAKLRMVSRGVSEI